jgi:CHAT domain-containing protein
MISEHEVLANIQTQVRRGADREITNYIQTLPSAIQDRPSIALERARAFLRQGRPIEAESVLSSINLDPATPGERLILTMEAAAIQIYRRIAIRQALETAAAAFATVENIHIDPSDRAEAERVQIRILLTAATYYEIPPERRRAERERLLAIAETLERAGQIDRSLAARFTYAERIDDRQQRIEALASLAERAINVDRPALAGEIQVVRAEQMLIAGIASDKIRAVLDAAKLLYAQVDCQRGSIDVAMVAAKLAIERELAGFEDLEACLANYQQIDFPKGRLNVLMDLSQLAHDRGDTQMAKIIRQQTIELAEAVGMGLAKDSSLTTQIDLLMRNSDYGEAIERCQAAIAGAMPTFSKAGYEQLLATAYSFIDDMEAACAHGKIAKEMFEAIGAIDSASDSTIQLASNLSSFRQDEKWLEAEVLLEEWIDKDKNRGDFDAAIAKYEMLAQIDILRALPQQEDVSLSNKAEQTILSAERLSARQSQREAARRLLDKAEQTILSAERLSAQLPQREAAKRLGSLQQMRGQIYQAKGDEDNVIQAWRNALAIYELSGLVMYAANCHYILGTLYLNRANRDLMPNFGESEQNFRAALAYYDAAGMRQQAADTRFMFARLYTNTSNQIVHKPDLCNQMRDAALGHLADAEYDYDAVRREFTAGNSVIDIQQGKRALIEKSQRIYELALEILCLVRPDPVEAWNWVQRAKARALSDVLGTGSIPPTRIMTEIERHPESFSLLLQERELVDRISKVLPAERLDLRETLDTVWENMARDPYLAEYLELRTGTALDAEDLAALITTDAQTGYSTVFIDWIAVGERLFLLALRPGQPAQTVELPLQLSTVRSFINSNLSPETFRSMLRDTPEVLRELDALISPLVDLTAAEELLIFSPTGALHALPLHALEIDGQPLLVRNPIVYCPSLSVLRHCLARRRTRNGKPTMAIFGDPSGDRPESAQLAVDLELRFETKALLKEAVTRQAFTEAISGCNFIHFQGHAVYEPHAPLDSHLVLAAQDPQQREDRLTAREIFGLVDLQAELVSLAACESAANVIATGDEPLGLIPAFLYAGTNSVLATLWKVHQTSAAATMRCFYDKLIETDRSINKAQALRQAMLAVRANPKFDRPYYWAPFALYGDWH